MTPEEEDIQRRRSSGGNNMGGSRQNHVRRSASAPSTDSTDDEWLQQQLNDAKKSLKKKRNEQSRNQWRTIGTMLIGDSPATTRKSSTSTSVIGRAQELAKEKVESEAVAPKRHRRKRMSVTMILETGERSVM